MFNNNINKPAITVFFATDFLPVAKTSFCRDSFFRGKTGFYRSLAKTCQPWFELSIGSTVGAE